MKYTIRDVAARAGVSPATVSNVLNGRGGVSETVRVQVLAAAEELGYQLSRKPERPADHLRLVFYRSGGNMVEENFFFLEMMSGVQQECRKNGLELMVSHVDAPEADYLDQIQVLRQEKCAGIILLATEMTPAQLAPFRGGSSPLVALDNSFDGEDVHCVMINNREAGTLAARELVRAGCRTFGFITSDVPFPNGEERGAGFREELARLGFPTGEELFWRVRPGKNEVYRETQRLIREREQIPEGIFAANDGFAANFIRALGKAGHRVPEEVSVVGMDDSGICEICTPRLTSIHVYCREMGARAAALALSLNGNPAVTPAVKISVGVGLVPRKSVRKGADEK